MLTWSKTTTGYEVSTRFGDTYRAVRTTGGRFSLTVNGEPARDSATTLAVCKQQVENEVALRSGGAARIAEDDAVAAEHEANIIKPTGGQHGSSPLPTASDEAERTEGEKGSDFSSVGVAPSVVPSLASARTSLLSGAFGGKKDSKVAGYDPTPEQAEILKAAVEIFFSRGSVDRCLVLPAGAGAGKTSTLKMLETVLAGSGQYTAFNRSLVQESKSKFKKARCSTTHGLAYGTVGKNFSHRLNGLRVRSDQIARILGIDEMSITTGVNEKGEPAIRRLSAPWLAGQIMVAVKRFCQSADRRIDRTHFKRIDALDSATEDGRPGWENNDIVCDYLLPFAEKAWADLSSTTGALPFSHDVYVKLWQLGEGPNKPLIPADYILLDEAQDTAPVFLDVLKQQTHALLIFVGDSNQAIYEWRGAVDAMQAFPSAPRKMLSQSFRFGQRIADVANSILVGLRVPTDLTLKGLETIPSVVTDAPLTRPKCILTRTNAAAISTVMTAQEGGRTTHLIASVEEVLSFVRAASDLQAGRSTTHPELGCFNKWSEVVEYSTTDEGEDLRLWVKLIEEFSTSRIIKALEAQTPEDQADLVVCTAHKSKGREWSSVQLASDFPPAIKMNDSDRRLLYVAATRAKHVLGLNGCPPFSTFRDRDGNESPGIRIVYTGPMPKLEEAVSIPEEKSSVQEEPTPTPRPVYSNGKVATEFSWRNHDGKWRVIGPAGQSNQTVNVVRRNGTSSTERLGNVVKEFSEGTIYDIKK